MLIYHAVAAFRRRHSRGCTSRFCMGTLHEQTQPDVVEGGAATAATGTTTANAATATATTAAATVTVTTDCDNTLGGQH